MVTVISQEQADRLCDEMDVWTEQLEPLSSFILPAGSPLISTIHLARTTAEERKERLFKFGMLMVMMLSEMLSLLISTAYQIGFLFWLGGLGWSLANRKPCGSR